jgi:GT2 family glycosyltransferase
MKLGPYRFSRPNDLELVSSPKLSVAVVIACRDGQDKLDLTLASLALQTYPKPLTKVYIIDDGSSPSLVLPKIRHANTKVIKYKNAGRKWGKTAATNDVVAKLREDVLWFIDADMVLEPDHLAHHMKWHHDADDYAVLGWKRFVKEWSYTPATLFAELKADGFDDLHTEHWGKKRWEERIDRTNDLEEPGIEGFRAFVGATFSLKRSLWESVGGYNELLKTGEDTELGWRLFLQGVRIVPDRQAHSWHLGLTSVESNKDETAKHNDPMIGQLVPGFAEIRKRGSQIWATPTFETLIDCRESTLSQIRAIAKNFQKLDENQGFFRLLGPWDSLNARYAIATDSYSNLREIHSWLLGDPQFIFEEISHDVNLTIESILQNFTVESSSYFFFVEGNAAPKFECLSLYTTLLNTGNGLVGFANNEDRRAFAVFAPALARARKAEGGLYKNISTLWGARWFTNDEIIRLYEDKTKFNKRLIRYIKNRIRKITSKVKP